MLSDWALVAAALVLILACGVFVAAEFAFVTVDRASVDRDAERGVHGARGLQAALKSLSTQLSGAQLGITITNLASGYLAEPAIAGLVGPALVDLGLAQERVDAVALAIGLVLATVLTMLFGELVPKNLAIARPRAVAAVVQRVQRPFTAAMALPIRGLNGSANLVVRALGIEPQEELASSRGPGELASAVRRSASQGTLDLGTADLVERALDFGSRTAGAIMTPRVRMHAADSTDSAADILDLARHSGRSRFPVIGTSFDAIEGVVHVKHAIGVPAQRRTSTLARDLAVPATLVPASVPIDDLMDRLRDEGLQLGVVVDEYGGTAGVVTLEDVVEEIVGEIADEHDDGRSAARTDGHGEWVLSGLLRPDEVTETTGLGLPESRRYETLAGLLLQELGHIPDAEESVTVTATVDTTDDEGLPEPRAVTVRLTVDTMVGRRIDRVRLVVEGMAR
ncbi:MAG TPA: hemolysin family protein [Nocardioidaceae bacterium]|nr:hemolysin family protein [Nocardioidaceae bacterium]